jgi:hypothetical protein
MMLQPSLLERFQGALIGASLHPDRPLTIPLLIEWICHHPDQPCPLPISHQPSQDALRLTPIWLYGHESWRQRKGWLAQVAPNYNDAASLWLFGEAIAQVMRPQFDRNTCLLTLLDRWYRHSRSGAPKLPDRWQQALLQTQDWLKQGRSMQSVMADCGQIDPNHRSLILALFGFLDQPQDCHITLARIEQTKDPIAAGLTAVLLGAHNGWSHFPIATLWPLQQTGTLPHLQHLATHLLRSWSGQTVITDISPPIVLAPR